MDRTQAVRGSIALVETRLLVIDLSAKVAYPAATPKSSCTVTRSGESTVPRLNGMFALAIVDERKDRSQPALVLVVVLEN
jgi:hypothetical protein